MKNQGNRLSTKAKVIAAIASGVVLVGAVAGILIATAHKHEYEPTVTDATCLEQGYTTYACECGEKYVDNYVSAKGHIDGNWIIDKEATCTEAGSKHQVCSVCDATIKTEVITKLGHTDGEWIVNKEANCTEDGSKHQVCSVCDATIKTETITKLGHTDGEWITDKEANCTEDGSKHQVCSVCEATIKTETITKLGHTDGEWITDKEENCTEDGSKHQVCSVCNESIKIETIISAGHDYTETITNATTENKASVKFDCKICHYSESKEVDRITVSVQLTGSGITMTGGGMYYTRTFEVTASGGYGEYQYKFESGSNLLQDFTTSNEIEIQGNVFVDNAEIKVTVMDGTEQKTVYIVKGNGSFVDSYVIYE